MLGSIPNIDMITQPDAAYCFVSASHRFKLPPESLLSLAMVEGGKIGSKSRNANGSFDLGIMQINTVWLNSASPLTPYVSLALLANDICTNVHTAAWILASNVTKSGGDIWRAVGMYHHPTNRIEAQQYIQKVNGKLPMARDILRNYPEYQKALGAFYKINETKSPSAPLRD